ncbi:tyrosyl-DNA phosphodiesterase 2-like [Phoenix dactylifera]|uniref:Tyrosyl-DNA phosphodiesterase 2-like n=1 Tax=Phoenix dactylifera TaxID=42345 RepID=A0A8B7C1L3_PHODC|nr:tyrosyl-DNA phosphodiesterase 2-like [Phoenix dactylifera]
MGNAESSSEFPSREPGESRQSRNKKSDEGEEQQSSAAGTALKVGAAVAAGTALLALGAWSASSSSSSSSSGSGDRRDITMERLDTGGSRCDSGHTHLQGSSRCPAEPSPFSYHLGDGNRNLSSRMIKIMSYNIWFREDAQVHGRMQAIGRLVQQHCPDLIFFQEVTPTIYGIFQSFEWWKDYNCSVPPERATRKYFCMMLSKLPVKKFQCVPFENSTMGRELCLAYIDVGMGNKLIAATTHLESPTPPEMNSAERVAQAKEAINLLNHSSNVVFGGDMNWDEGSDGSFPQFDGWADAWTDLRPGENGWTYDTKSNPMLKGNFPLQKRLDRFVCKLADFRLIDISMIGMEAIPGLLYYKKSKVLPVLPSDHYALLLTMRLV